MAGKSLKELVSAALTEADRGLKLASARDADILDPGDFLTAELDYLKTAEDESEEAEEAAEAKAEKKEKAKEKAEEKKASLRVVLGDAEYAMKLAEALELGGNVITAKLATEGQSHTDAPGPTVMESGFEGAATVHPKAVTTSVPGSQKSHGGGGSERTMGAPNGIETNKADFTSMGDESGAAKNHPGKTAGWTRSKTATVRLLNAKIAQAQTLRRLGQIKAAEQLESEIQKQAADFEVAGETDANISAGKGQGRLDTEPGEAGHIPDNAGLISMTRAQARDKTTREAGQYISETPKTDNAVAAHTLTTQGLKMSSLIVPQKVAERSIPREWDENYQGRVGAGLLGATGGLYGGVLGGAVGDAIGKGHDLKSTLAGVGIGALIGGAGGAVGGRALGRWGAKAMKEDELLKAKMLGQATEHGRKQASDLDPELAKAYLRKVAALAQDPEATPAERSKAAGLIQQIQARTAINPDELLG